MEKNNSVTQNLLEYLKDKTSGTTFIYDDFSGCGTYTAIRSSVVKLCREGYLHRVCQGVYVKPNVDGSFAKLSNIHIAREIDRRTSDMTEPYGSTLDYVEGKIKKKPSILYFNTHSATRQIELPDGTIVKYRKINR